MDFDLNTHGAARFDWIVRNERAPSGEAWDAALVETPSFVAIPSLGSIVPGWVLIVPRLRSVNLAKLTPAHRHELARLSSAVSNTLAARFQGEVFEFEHGPASAGGLLGCGVEQAHLHLVPLPFDLVKAVASAPEAGVVELTSVEDPWLRIRSDADYWLARNVESGMGVITYPGQPISQGIRKIIAAQVGRSEAWNYRSDLHLDNVCETLRAFSSYEA